MMTLWPHKEHLLGILFLLAVRGLGKARRLGERLPPSQQGPEDIVAHLIDKFLPSVCKLRVEVTDLVKLALDAFKTFSLPQFLQGENTPAQILKLEQMVHMHGQHLLHFVLVSQVGIMCGLAGAKRCQGCAFMDEQNSKNILSAIRVLRCVGRTDCHNAYWSYILDRGRGVGLQTHTLEQVALARLACLCRINESNRTALETDWNKLSPFAREALTENFIADGIDEVAFTFTFLPMFLVNAQANTHIGMTRALELLVELLEALRHEGAAKHAGSKDVSVSIQDLGMFLKEVESPKIFFLIGPNCQISYSGGSVRITVHKRLKELSKTGITGALDQQDELPGVMFKILRKISELDQRIQISESGGDDTKPSTKLKKRQPAMEAGAAHSVRAERVVAGL